MCLVVSSSAEKRFRKRHKNKKKIVVWKVVTKKYQTIYRMEPVKEGWFKAKDVGSNPIIRQVVNELDMTTHKEVTYGAIHVYTTRKHARKVKYPSDICIRCEALMEDLIGVGIDNNACFNKIWIPKFNIIERKV